jgi:hypothetical protein
MYQLIPAADTTKREKPGGGRKLLMFSDSRQAAAYFAPYLQDSYARLQRRRLLYQGAISATDRGADTTPTRPLTSSRSSDHASPVSSASERYRCWRSRRFSASTND